MRQPLLVLVSCLALCASFAKGDLAQPSVLFSWSNLTFTTTCQQEYVVENNALAGVKSYKGEFYVSIPRWRHGVPATLAKVVPGATPALTPYPSCQWQTIGDPSALQVG